HRRVGLASQEHVDVAAVEALQNGVGLRLVEEAALDRVGARQVAQKGGDIQVDALALVSVVDGGRRARNVGKARRVEQRGGHGSARQIRGGGADVGAIHIPVADRRSALFRVVEEVPV